MLDSYDATQEEYDAPVMNVYFRDGGPYHFYLTEAAAAAYLPERNKNQYLSNPDVYVITGEEMYPDLVDKSPTPCHTRPLLALVLALVHALPCNMPWYMHWPVVHALVHALVHRLVHRPLAPLVQRV